MSAASTSNGDGHETVSFRDRLRYLPKAIMRIAFHRLRSHRITIWTSIRTKYSICVVFAAYRTFASTSINAKPDSGEFSQYSRCETHTNQAFSLLRIRNR